jgi:hypothetical protein
MVLLLAGGNAAAQIDPDTDGVGIYTDASAEIYCSAHPAGAPSTIVVCLTNPSAQGGVYGWEAKITFPVTLFILATVYTGGGLNVGDPLQGQYIVGIPSPLPWAPVIVLCTFTILTTIPDCSWIYMGPLDNASIPGEMVYADGADPGNLIIMRGSTGGPDIPVYGINCDCPPPIPNESETWGGVKALYR